MFLLLQQRRAVFDEPGATTGIKGLRKADKILRKYGVAGLLIGGMAKTIWENSNNLDEINSRKDVDVVVLGYSCKHHPKQWEGGIDWWVSHSLEDLPTNGKSCLNFNIQIWEEHVSLFPGLYLCPHDILERIVDYENKNLSMSSSYFSVREGDIFYKIPTVESDCFKLFLSTERKDPIHCKPLF